MPVYGMEGPRRNKLGELKKEKENENLPNQSTQEELNKRLFDAAKTGSLYKVKSLINQGADVNAQNNNGTQPLNLAAQEGHLEVVKWLVEAWCPDK